MAGWRDLGASDAGETQAGVLDGGASNPAYDLRLASVEGRFRTNALLAVDYPSMRAALESLTGWKLLEMSQVLFARFSPYTSSV